jgi:putative toxin-antitoxin system antitoxin component (TIGR02293 family)
LNDLFDHKICSNYLLYNPFSLMPTISNKNPVRRNQIARATPTSSSLKVAITISAQTGYILTKYRSAIASSYSIVDTALRGVSVEILNELATLLPLQGLKILPRRPLRAKVLAPESGEQSLKLIALYQKGVELFGSSDIFNQWLSKPNYGLNFAVPLELMRTSGGKDLVIEELIRIEYGDLA